MLDALFKVLSEKNQQTFVRGSRWWVSEWMGHTSGVFSGVDSSFDRQAQINTEYIKINEIDSVQLLGGCGNCSNSGWRDNSEAIYWDLEVEGDCREL